MILETDRLHLRPLEAGDLDQVAALHADPVVMRFITGRSEAREMTRARILPDLLGRLTWAAQDRRSGDFLGWFSLRLHGEGEAELGYRLHRAAWGRDLAARVLARWWPPALAIWASPASGPKPWRSIWLPEG
jgi:RimJ/RimL family protein N-acetyltransferase